MKIEQKLIDNCADQTLTVLGKFIKPDHLERFKGRYKDSSQHILSDNISYCVDKFVQTELDSKTAGKRGLGRLTEGWPRLGAYFREQISSMDSKRLEELDSLITALVVKCYLFPIITADNAKTTPKIKEADKLYEKWVPRMYSFNLSSLEDWLGALFTATLESDFTNIKVFFKENDMNAGFWEKDKTDEILYGYSRVGFALRFAED